MFCVVDWLYIRGSRTCESDGCFYFRAEQKKCKKLSKEKDVLNREISSQNDKIREMAKHEKELVENLKSLEEELEKLQKLLK